MGNVEKKNNFLKNARERENFFARELQDFL